MRFYVLIGKSDKIIYNVVELVFMFVFFVPYQSVEPINPIKEAFLMTGQLGAVSYSII